MFIRVKPSGPRRYLQIVKSIWDKGNVRQKVIGTIGRLDQLKESGELDSLLRSGVRFSEKLAVIDAYEKGQIPATEDVRIGLPMVFERLWKETGISTVIEELLGERKYRFPVERAVFLTVLHRLSVSGSDRAAEKWKEQYRIAGARDRPSPLIPGDGMAWGDITGKRSKGRHSVFTEVHKGSDRRGYISPEQGFVWRSHPGVF